MSGNPPKLTQQKSQEVFSVGHQSSSVQQLVLSSSLSKLEELSLLEPELLACRVNVVVYSELLKLLSHRTALLGIML